MVVDIQNEIRTYVKAIVPNATVVSAYPEITPTFPLVVLGERSNQSDNETYDTSGEKFNVVDLEVEIFTIGSSKKSDALAVRKTIDDLLSGTYRMRRTFSDEITNYADRNVYRYQLRYSFKINEQKVIYRR